MLFNTLEYLVFFVAVFLIAWFLVGLRNYRVWFILAASFFFYASNNQWQTFILLFTTTVDYYVAMALGRTDDPRRRRWLLLVSVVSNLGVLCWFKYVGFVATNLIAVAQLLGYQPSWVDLNVLLPVGISFYTFEALSYTFDVYRRRIQPEPRWHRLAFLVSFFPHLIAGPIVRAADFFPQMDRRPRLSFWDVEHGLFLIFAGLFKKIVLADQLAPFADQAFGTPESVDSLVAWVGMYAFAFQIYFDFSGYTDIALGSARLLGYRLPKNFNRPYAAASITDFWNRWHISLSTWLRDYLYIPLGGNRMATRWGVSRNLMLTMLLGGLWHGAAWHYVVWGGLHGFYLTVERLLSVNRRASSWGMGARVLRGVVYFQLVAFTWIPFRADTLGQAWALVRRMFAFQGPETVTVGTVGAIAVMGYFWAWQAADEAVGLKRRLAQMPVLAKGLAYGLVAVLVVVLNSGAAQTFIYFQF